MKFHLVFVLLCFLLALPVFGAGASYDVTDLELRGNVYTRRSWLVQYLGLSFPISLTEEDTAEITNKLLTTGVFVTVDLNLRETAPKSNKYILVIELNEKWTAIPVIRGAYGGGTPLKVLGVYDTHVFGSLWTLGLESRQYGNSPPGLVGWARAPRWLTGKYVIGGELWREFRERGIYDDDGELLGTINTSAVMGRGLFLMPFGEDTNSGGGLVSRSQSNWQYGLDVRIRREGPSVFEPESATKELLPSGIRLQSDPNTQTSTLPTFVYDNIAVDNVTMRGMRFIGVCGPLFDIAGVHSRTEAELFYYWSWAERWNAGLHAFAAQSTHDAVQDQYFLGGFDSIRGLPDGAIYGTRATYYNLELRHLTAKWKYLWIQNAVFADSGGAARGWDEVGSRWRSAAGAGIRFAFPYVYRLMFRFDYAWSIGDDKTHGITAGLNQFFDPYRPL